MPAICFQSAFICVHQRPLMALTPIIQLLSPNHSELYILHPPLLFTPPSTLWARIQGYPSRRLGSRPAKVFEALSGLAVELGGTSVQYSGLCRESDHTD